MSLRDPPSRIDRVGSHADKSVIGEPTGTSVKFANMMSEAVKKFFAEKNMNDIEITLMPLEGDGIIDHRVDK